MSPHLYTLPLGTEILLSYLDFEGEYIKSAKQIIINTHDDGVEIHGDLIIVIKYHEPYPIYNGKKVKTMGCALKNMSPLYYP